jgi:prepilin peptidase CpaA
MLAEPAWILGLNTLQAALLVVTCWTDLSRRIIPNSVCIGVMLVGIAVRLAAGPVALLESTGVAAAVFALLLVLHARGGMGGGDVKLITALVLGRSLPGTIQLLSVMALVGGVLALLQLALRAMPCPVAVPVDASTLRRAYAAERRRSQERASLPYGVAIACGGLWTILLSTGG